MTQKRKPAIREAEVFHACSKEELLDRIGLVLFGNGHPEDGLAFMFRASIKDSEEIKNHTSDIKDSVEKLAKMYDDTFDAATTTASALEKYKIEVKSFEAGKKDAEEKKKIADDLKKEKAKNHWQRIFWIITAVLGLVGLGANIYFNVSGHTETVQRVEAVQDTIRQEMRYQEGISKKTRGGWVKYNDNGISDSIKIR